MKFLGIFKFLITLIFLVLSKNAYTNLYDGSYNATFAYKMSSQSVCPKELPISIDIEVINNNIKGYIVNQGNPENSHAFCKVYHDGTIKGKIDNDGNFIDLVISQKSSHSKKYSSYKITGSLKGESVLVSRSAKYHPPFKFNWNLVTKNNVSKKNNQQPDNSTAENKSNINKLGSGPYDGLYFSKFDYKMRGNTCKNSLPLEISIEIIDSQIKGFIDNLGNSKNKNQYCALYHNGEITGTINEKGKFKKVKISQVFKHSKKYSSYKINGNLNKAILVSKNSNMHPSFKFEFKKVIKQKNDSSSATNKKNEIKELKEKLNLLQQDKKKKLSKLEDLRKSCKKKYKRSNNLLHKEIMFQMIKKKKEKL